MSGSVRWVGVVLAATLGACSGRLEHEIEAYEQGASARPGSTGGNAGGSAGASAGTGGSGATAAATPPAGGGANPPATGGAPVGAGGAGGSGAAGAGTAGTGGAGGSMAVTPPVKMDGGPWRDSGGAPDAQPTGSATPAPSSAGCAPGLDALAIMVRRCGACHGERTPTKGLDLVTPGVATRLVGVRSGCQARPFLDPMPGAPESYFLEKLDRAVAGCGVQMPFGAPPLSADERACLQDWAEKAIARGVSGR